MIALFLIIVAAIIFAPIIKAVGKAGIYLMLILIGVGWIGSQFGGSSSTTAPATPTAMASPTPDPAVPTATPTPPPLSAEDQTFVDNAGHWIKTDTWGGRSKEDLNELMNMALSDDTTAQAGMVREGRAVVLKQGQRVQLQDTAIFSGMVKVRPVGETESWWISLGLSSKTPIMTHDEKLSAVQATAPGIDQKPLTGSLSALKLFVGQPLAAWKEAYPSGKPSINNPNAYFFNAGRFLIAVVFDEKSGMGNEVSISEAQGKAPVTVEEAAQIANSIGLSKPPVKDVEDPKTLNWNKEGDPLFAHFGTDTDDLILWIIVNSSSSASQSNAPAASATSAPAIASALVITNEEKPKEERVARPPSHWRSHYDPPAEAHYVREITDLIAPHMAKQIAKDPDAAAEQARLLIGYTKELAKEGEVTDLQYLEAAKIWLEMGFGPRSIAEVMPVFADTLHGSKDAEWTDYDMARIIGEAIRGKQQALESLHLGGLEKVNSNEERFVEVKQALEKRYKGANRKAKEGGEAYGTRLGVLRQ